MDQIESVTANDSLQSKSETESQHIIRRSLELLDGGRNHVIGTWYLPQGGMCMWTAIVVAHGASPVKMTFDNWRNPPPHYPEHEILHEAIIESHGEMGPSPANDICHANNTMTWPEIEAIFQRAYTLAANVG